MLNKFSRTELLIGSQSIEKLKNSAVAVFGVGGVGSHTVESLARTGVGSIDLIDDDKVCLTNINRQIMATDKTVGQIKVEAMKNRILEINPKCNVTAFQCFYGAETAETISLEKYDYIVDAIDTISSKLLLIERANKAGVPIISCMSAGNKLNPTEFEVTDIYKTSVCPIARVMRKELKARNITSLKVVYSKEASIKPIANEDADCKFNCVCPPESSRKCVERRQIPGSISFVPAVAGYILASEVIKDLLGISN
jgi:tRNA A37 threonylcarbamoyladenosine dehydratase